MGPRRAKTTWDKNKLGRLTLPDFKFYYRDFLGSAVVKNPPASAGDMGSTPGPGRSHMPQRN